MSLTGDGGVTRDPVRFWNLAQMAKSPAHYLASLTARDDPTTAMELGTAAHALILGGRPVIAYPGPVRRGKEWEQFKALHADDIVLNRTDAAAAQRMARAIEANADAMRVLGGEREKTILFKLLHRECRATPDSLGSILGELKTSNTADPAQFMWQARRRHYHAQVAWYRQAAICVGKKPDECCFVVVESIYPHPVTVMRLTDRALEEGERRTRIWFERLLVCEDAGEYPGYAQSVVDFDVPEDEDVALTFAEDVAA